MEQITYTQHIREVLGSDLAFEVKLHIIESDISLFVYRIWCRITGGRFEVREKDNTRVCVVVTKHGSIFSRICWQNEKDRRSNRQN